MKWLMNEHEPDLYDARMRDWYIKAAASPKEIVILLDSSGKLNHLVKDYKTYDILLNTSTLTFSEIKILTQPNCQCYKTCNISEMC